MTLSVAYTGSMFIMIKIILYCHEFMFKYYIYQICQTRCCIPIIQINTGDDKKCYTNFIIIALVFLPVISDIGMLIS